MRKMMACVVGSVICLAASGADASFHLIHVEEVFAGNTANPAAQYIQLSMFAAGQTFVSNSMLVIYGPTGTALTTITPTNVTNGAASSKVLIATTEAQTLFGITADKVAAFTLPIAGGAVCWLGTPDCVTWGNFAGTLPEVVTNPFNPSTGLSGGMAIHRGGDTNNSAADFSTVAPLPINNAGQEGSLNGPVDLAGTVDLATPVDLAASPADLAAAAGPDMAMAIASSGGGCELGGGAASGALVAIGLLLATALLLRTKKSRAG